MIYSSKNKLFRYGQWKYTLTVETIHTQNQRESLETSIILWYKIVKKEGTSTKSPTQGHLRKKIRTLNY